MVLYLFGTMVLYYLNFDMYLIYLYITYFVQTQNVWDLIYSEYV